MKKYGLLHIKTNTILSMSSIEPDEESDLSTMYHLECDQENSNMWLVNNESLANLVRCNPSDEYTSSSDCPMHNFNPEDLQVIEVEIKTEAVKNISEYTYLNFLQDLKQQYLSVYNDEAAVKMTERSIQDFLKDKEKLSPKALDKKYKIPLFQLKNLKPEFFK